MDTVMNNNNVLPKTLNPLETHLSKIDEIIDWQEILVEIHLITQKNNNIINIQGENGVAFLKIIFLQYLYNLTNKELLHQLLDRKSFQHFVGIPDEEIGQAVNEAFIIKEHLNHLSILDSFFLLIDVQLEKKGLMLLKGSFLEFSLLKHT